MRVGRQEPTRAGSDRGAWGEGGVYLTYRRWIRVALSFPAQTEFWSAKLLFGEIP